MKLFVYFHFTVLPHFKVSTLQKINKFASPIVSYFILFCSGIVAVCYMMKTPAVNCD